ncbi:MAG: hypothetical protein AUH20_00280 [Candidatus Rokubacteria bacterium 13_2_20CM_69_15_2]|nr:MAG: hypothetical protein AUH20_00280 [Candidatus Rokubacteria bacterium 13_2_20CM_69_15_2]
MPASSLASRARRSGMVFWSSASTVATISARSGPAVTLQAFRMTTASLRRSSAWPAPRYAQSHARRSGYTKGEGSGVSTWRVQSSPSWILSRRRRSRGTSNASVKHSRRVSATTGNSARPPTASRSASALRRCRYAGVRAPRYILGI